MQTMNEIKCTACHGEAGRERILREMMYGTREEFVYWECIACGCLQIAEVPENLADHYPSNYYSFSMEASAWSKMNYRAHFAAPRSMKLLRRCPADVASVISANPRPGAKILDVGCGGGRLVGVLRSLGFDAHGIDPFGTSDRPYIQRCSLDEIQGKWDLIMFHHSLEHMSNHAEVLQCVRSKLGSDGQCIVRIPIASWAWKHYGKDWVQLDAPRHLVIHTLESFRLTAQSASLRVERIIFDSDEFQFYASELYQRDIPLHDSSVIGMLSRRQIRSFRRRAADLNSQQLGDQAAFILSTNG
jgi:2-polyprenyl-3-methyl-5-hydroxy-6-metoxy-1,4-benzoquinol methylase